MCWEIDCGRLLHQKKKIKNKKRRIKAALSEIIKTIIAKINGGTASHDVLFGLFIFNWNCSHTR